MPVSVSNLWLRCSNQTSLVWFGPTSLSWVNVWHNIFGTWCLVPLSHEARYRELASLIEFPQVLDVVLEACKCFHLELLHDSWTSHYLIFDLSIDSGLQLIIKVIITVISLILSRLGWRLASKSFMCFLLRGSLREIISEVTRWKTTSLAASFAFIMLFLFCIHYKSFLNQDLVDPLLHLCIGPFQINAHYPFRRSFHLILWICELFP